MMISADRTMDGGCASGFRHVEPTKYEPRLFIVKKSGRRVEIKQIPMRMKYINAGDVFIMDLGLKIYQWNGSSCSKVISPSALVSGLVPSALVSDCMCKSLHSYDNTFIVFVCRMRSTMLPRIVSSWRVREVGPRHQFWSRTPAPRR